MKQLEPHPIDLERRAITAHRRHIKEWDAQGSYCRTLNDQLYVVVTSWGAAIAVYALKANGKLRRLADWPTPIW
jgi:hypothetical protein